MSDLLRLLRLFRPYRRWLLAGMLLALLTLLANVALLAVSGWFITAMAAAGAAGVSMNYFTPAALIRAAAIVRTAGRYSERLVTHEATFRLLAGLRVWLYRRIEPLAPAGLDAYRSGDLLSRLRADIDTLDQVYLRLLVPVVVAMVAVPVFTAVLLRYQPLLALVVVPMLLVSGVGVPWLVNRLGRSAGRQKVETAAGLRAALVTDVQGMGELLVYGAAERHGRQVQALSRELARQQQTLNGLHGISQGALGLFASLAMWGVLLIAIPMVQAQTLAPAHLTMLALFTLASFEAVMPLPLAMQTLGEILTAARRIFGLADSQPVVREPDEPLPVPERPDYRLHDVSFRYRADGAAVLQGVSLALPPGRTLAVVGETGCGKSTLVSLLLRFRDPDSGSILVNDTPLDRYSGEGVRERIAALSQQTHLFNTTILDNLLLANPAASRRDVEAACEAASIHAFIAAQPDGYDTLVGETGVRLSGGQARRVAVARVLLKAAPVVILDEPTEGLDAVTARRMMDKLLARVQARGQSLLLITHRLQGLERLDEILVMAQGRVIESGTHRALMAGGGYYRRLYASSLPCEWGAPDYSPR